MSNVLRVQDLIVEFQGTEGSLKAVDGVSFAIPAGKTVALVGESGSGKTVVSQSILRLLPKNAIIRSGEILFFETSRPGSFVDIARLKPNSRDMRSIRGDRISIVFQEPMTSLSPVHTIGDQIGETLRVHRSVSRAEAREFTSDMLQMVGFPDYKRAIDRYPFELSGGLRQRAMIAMALVCRPVLLIADEPTTALDVTIQAQILKLMSDLKDELGMAILIITHDLGVVANVADEVVVMYKGKVVERGGIEQIYESPGHPYLRALMRAVPRVGMKKNERLIPLREINTDSARFFGRTRPATSTMGKDEPLLRVESVKKGFSTRKTDFLNGRKIEKTIAVDDVSFFINRGECLGLVGESGCGKTTTSKMIMRAIEPDEGHVYFTDDGKSKDVYELSEADLLLYRRKVQFIFQDPFSSLNPRMTTFDIISEPLNIHRVGTRDDRADRVRELMNMVGLDVRFLRRYPHSFSGGQRQRIGIARALALQPELIICDEPVSALDVSVQAQVLNLLKDLKTQLGLTYLFISHNLAVVDYIADRIAVMCAGRLVEVAPREVLFQSPLHPYTKALLAAVPNADPTKKLNLTVLMKGKASDPEAWEIPFNLSPGIRVEMIDAGNGHFVRVHQGSDLSGII